MHHPPHPIWARLLILVGVGAGIAACAAGKLLAPQILAAPSGAAPDTLASDPTPGGRGIPSPTVGPIQEAEATPSNLLPNPVAPTTGPCDGCVTWPSESPPVPVSVMPSPVGGASVLASGDNTLVYFCTGQTVVGVAPISLKTSGTAQLLIADQVSISGSVPQTFSADNAAQIADLYPNSDLTDLYAYLDPKYEMSKFSIDLNGSYFAPDGHQINIVPGIVFALLVRDDLYTSSSKMLPTFEIEFQDCPQAEHASQPTPLPSGWTVDPSVPWSP